jgi:CRISPR-associated protein Csm4
MPAAYRIRFRLASPLATRLHSGTLFGNLCWAWRYLHGEASLAKWLCSLPEDPFLISDGFPKDMLPRPLLRPSPKRPGTLAEVTAQKRLKKQSLIPRKMFEQLRRAMSELALLHALMSYWDEQKQQQECMTPYEREKAGTARWERTAHNRIHRLTGRTPEEGGLFFTEELWTTGQAQYHDVYVQTSLPVNELEQLFSQVARWGYGKDATWGRGRFDGIEIYREDGGLFDGALPRAMSLSHGSLTPNMLPNARYQLETHYGRLGGVYACSSSPFKFPLLLLTPGATFDAGPGPFGEILTGVHPTMPAVRHNAWHLTVTFREVD